MVEMLGNLAIIAILSITGISGYTYVMIRYQTNQIVSELNLVRNQINMIMNHPKITSYQLSLEGNKQLNSIHTRFTYGCGIDTTIISSCYHDDMVYYQQLNGINKTLCQSIVQSMQFMPNLIEQRVNDKIDTTGKNCTGNENKLTFFFEKEAAAIDSENCSKLHPVYNIITNQREACPAN